mmetsp:Transcript_29695/g.74602  ORF Transcript_29695/g.74602 Transcript_29695/m.74602 type:complete len:226 (+) Transcript_29695:189-866(+)
MTHIQLIHVPLRIDQCAQLLQSLGIRGARGPTGQNRDAQVEGLQVPGILRAVQELAADHEAVVELAQALHLGGEVGLLLAAHVPGRVAEESTVRFARATPVVGVLHSGDLAVVTQSRRLTVGLLRRRHVFADGRGVLLLGLQALHARHVDQLGGRQEVPRRLAPRFGRAAAGQLRRHGEGEGEEDEGHRRHGWEVEELRHRRQGRRNLRLADAWIFGSRTEGRRR